MYNQFEMIHNDVAIVKVICVYLFIEKSFIKYFKIELIKDLLFLGTLFFWIWLEQLINWLLTPIACFLYNYNKHNCFLNAIGIFLYKDLCKNAPAVLCNTLQKIRKLLSKQYSFHFSDVILKITILFVVSISW